MATEFYIQKPDGFHLQAAVCGHGWYDLLPFEWDSDVETLKYVFRCSKGKRLAPGAISQSEDKIKVTLQNSSVDLLKAERDVRHILRLDDDMSDFYRMAQKVPGSRWVTGVGGGRLLRSATVYEDMVKTLCTTNCSWSLTRNMVANLVSKLGKPAGRGARSFPTAEEMASVDEKFYREVIRAGYRSPFFVELATRVRDREIDPESFLTSDLPTDELRKEIKKIKGFGDYAADNLLKLLGRFDYLALDSWLRSRFHQKHNKGKPCADKSIEHHYASYGKWKGLMIWCDMTEDWFETK